MSFLILVRHGKSEWNKLGLWTGWKDIPLCKEGKEEAKLAALSLKDIKIDYTFTATLQRSIQTLEIIKKELGIPNLPTIMDKALNERNYGIYTGKNKWQLQREMGEKKFKLLRRSWNYPIPEGETIKDVYGRVVPFFKSQILPLLKQGLNVLIAAHGNSLRALEKYIENLTEEALMNLEIGVGEIHIYEIDQEGKMLGKEVRVENPDKGKI